MQISLCFPNFGTCVLESKAEQQQELGEGTLWEGTSSALAGCHKEKELFGWGGDGLGVSAVSTVHESCRSKAFVDFNAAEPCFQFLLCSSDGWTLAG